MGYQRRVHGEYSFIAGLARFCPQTPIFCWPLSLGSVFEQETHGVSSVKLTKEANAGDRKIFSIQKQGTKK